MYINLIYINIIILYISGLAVVPQTAKQNRSHDLAFFPEASRTANPPKPRNTARFGSSGPWFFQIPLGNKEYILTNDISLDKTLSNNGILQDISHLKHKTLCM